MRWRCRATFTNRRSISVRLAFRKFATRGASLCFARLGTGRMRCRWFVTRNVPVPARARPVGGGLFEGGDACLARGQIKGALSDRGFCLFGAAADRLARLGTQLISAGGVFGACFGRKFQGRTVSIAGRGARHGKAFAVQRSTSLRHSARILESIHSAGHLPALRAIDILRTFR